MKLMRVFILISLLLFVSLVSGNYYYTSSDFSLGTHTNTVATSDYNLIMGNDGSDYYSSGNYLSQIIDFYPDAEYTSFSFAEDFNYGISALPDSACSDCRFDMSDNVFLAHIDKNYQDTFESFRTDYWGLGANSSTSIVANELVLTNSGTSEKGILTSGYILGPEFSVQADYDITDFPDNPSNLYRAGMQIISDGWGYRAACIRYKHENTVPGNYVYLWTTEGAYDTYSTFSEDFKIRMREESGALVCEVDVGAGFVEVGRDSGAFDGPRSVWITNQPGDAGGYDIVVDNFIINKGEYLDDDSGNSNHAYLQSGIRNSSGKFDGAITFDGSSDYAYVPDDATLDLNDTYTLSAWVNSSNSSAGGHSIISKSDESTNKSYKLETYDAGDTVRFSSSADGSVWETMTGSSISDSEWTLITVVKDGANGYLYIDGALDTTKTDFSSSTYSGSANAEIGSVNSGTESWNGKLDEVAIWDRAMSESEVRNLYRLGVADLNVEVRSCSDSTCSEGESFVNYTDGNVTHSLSLDPNRYFQYRVNMIMNDTTLASGVAPRLMDINIVVPNRVPDINFISLEGSSLDSLISMSNDYNGDLNILFEIRDYDLDSLTVDVNYVRDGVHTSIVSSLDMNSDYCVDTNFADYTQCSLDWNTSGVEDGNYTLSLLVSDSKQTSSDTSSAFNIDQSAPQTTAIYNSGWQIDDFNIVLECTDGNGAGCTDVNYRLDTNSQDDVEFGSWQIYSSPITISQDGNYALEFYSEDGMGYSEDVNTIYALKYSYPNEIVPKDSDSNVETFFGNDTTVALEIDMDNNYYKPFISIIDSQGSILIENDNQGYSFDSNTYTYTFDINSDMDYGFYDINVNSRVFRNVFYKTYTWEDETTDNDSNIFVFSIDLNVENSSSIDYFNTIAKVDIDFNYSATPAGVRVITQNADENYIEVPSQIIDQNISEGYLKDGNVIFYATIGADTNKEYKLVYTNVDRNRDYDSDISILEDEDNNVLSVTNLFYDMNIDTQSGFQDFMVQTSFVDETVSTERYLAPFISSYSNGDINPLNSNSSLSVIESGSIIQEYMVDGNISGIIDFNMLYRFNSALPYYEVDLNLKSNEDDVWSKYESAKMYVYNEEFGKYYYLADGSYGSGNFLDDSGYAFLSLLDLNYFSFYNDTNYSGYMYIDKGYESSLSLNPFYNFYDSSTTDTLTNKMLSDKVITTGDYFYNTEAHVLYEDTSDINYWNEVLINPVSILSGSTSVNDSTLPVVTDVNYTPYGAELYDTNTLTCTASVSDNIQVEYAIFNLYGPGVDQNNRVNVLSSSADINSDFNVNAGDYNCIVYAYDVATLSDINYLDVNMSVQDATGPNIYAYDTNVDSNADIDPNVSVLFDANVIEYSTLSSVDLYAYYYDSDNNLIDSNTYSMSCTSLSDYNYNCTYSLTMPETEYRVDYAIYALDNLSNTSNTDTNTLYSYYEWTWASVDDFEDGTPVNFDSNGDVGTITINNTGDKNLSFSLSSDWVPKSEIYYNDNTESSGYTFSLNVSESQDVNVKVIGKSADLGPTTSSLTVTIDANEALADPDTNTHTTSVISRSDNNSYLFSDTIDGNLLLTQGDENVVYSTTITNYGGLTCDSGYLWWSVPDDFVITDNDEYSISSLAYNSSLTKTITVSVDENATLGETSISVVSGCLDSEHDVNGNTKTKEIVVQDVNGNTTVVVETTTTVTNTVTGGGGGGGGGSGFSSVSQVLEEIQTASSFFEASDQVKIVRGEDENFNFYIKNPFTKFDLNSVKIEVIGSLKNYFDINPQNISIIKSEERKEILISLNAPKYLESGSNKIDFKISGIITGDRLSRDVDEDLINFDEIRTIDVFVLEFSEETALMYLDDMNKTLDKLSFEGYYIGRVDDLLVSARAYFDVDKYVELKEDYDRLMLNSDSAEYTSQMINKLGALIEDAKSKYLNVDESEKLLLYATSALERGDFISSKEIIDNAYDTYILETKGEISLRYILEAYWIHILIIILGLSLIGVGLFKVIRKRGLKLELRKLKEEEGILVFLMKDVQNKCFVQNKMSVDEYHSAMTQYEDRLNKILEREIRINYELKYFKHGERALLEEKKDLLSMMKDLQKRYFYSNSIPSHTYKLKFASLLNRVSEIDAELAQYEFSKEYKKYKGKR